MREKGSFPEPGSEECPSPSSPDGTSPSSSSSPPFSLINSALLNSQTQFNHHSASLPCTASKRSQKLTNNEDLSTTNSLVQTTTRNAKISNGNDDDSSSTYKQQKKQLVKSSNLPSRRQQRKQETKEQTRPASRDSSASYNNGFPTSASSENAETDKRYIFLTMENDWFILSLSACKSANSKRMFNGWINRSRSRKSPKCNCERSCPIWRTLERKSRIYGRTVPPYRPSEWID